MRKPTIADILRRLDRDYPIIPGSDDQSSWGGQQVIYGAWLEATVADLLRPLRRILPPSAFDGSMQEYLRTTIPFPTIAEYRVRPINDYYGGTPPRCAEFPDNPDAMGLALTFRLVRGYRGRVAGDSCTATFVVSFEVWGELERAAFIAMYNANAWGVQRLLDIPKLEFFTATVLEELDDLLPTSDAREALSRYASVSSDGESNFTLHRSFDAEDVSSDLVSAVALRLMALYEITFSYRLRDPILEDRIARIERAGC